MSSRPVRFCHRHWAPARKLDLSLRIIPETPNKFVALPAYDEDNDVSVCLPKSPVKSRVLRGSRFSLRNDLRRGLRSAMLYSVERDVKWILSAKSPLKIREKKQAPSDLAYLMKNWNDLPASVRIVICVLIDDTTTPATARRVLNATTRSPTVVNPRLWSMYVKLRRDTLLYLAGRKSVPVVSCKSPRVMRAQIGVFSRERTAISEIGELCKKINEGLDTGSGIVSSVKDGVNSAVSFVKSVPSRGSSLLKDIFGHVRSALNLSEGFEARDRIIAIVSTILAMVAIVSRKYRKKSLVLLGLIELTGHGLVAQLSDVVETYLFERKSQGLTDYAVPLTTLIVTLIGFSLPGKVGEFDVTKLSSKLSTHLRTLNSLASLPEVIVKIFNHVQEWFPSLISSNDLVKQNYQAIHSFYDDVKEALTPEGKKKISENRSYALFVANFAYRAAALRPTVGTTYPRELREKFAVCYKEAKSLADIAAGSSASGFGEKGEVTAFYLEGASGIGKTTITKSFASAILCSEQDDDYISTFDSDTAIYARYAAQEYWDGFHGGVQCVVFDDFGQTRDTVATPATDFIDIIQSTSSFPFHPHMAAIEDKGSTSFNATLFIATSNTKITDLQIESINHPEALRRRFDHCFRVTIKDSFAKKITPDGGAPYLTLDKDSALLDLNQKKLKDASLADVCYNYDVYSFQEYDAVTGKNVGLPISYNEAIVLATKAYAKKAISSVRAKKSLDARLKIDVQASRARVMTAQMFGYNIFGNSSTPSVSYESGVDDVDVPVDFGSTRLIFDNEGERLVEFNERKRLLNMKYSKTSNNPTEDELHKVAGLDPELVPFGDVEEVVCGYSMEYLNFQDVITTSYDKLCKKYIERVKEVAFPTYEFVYDYVSSKVSSGVGRVSQLVKDSINFVYQISWWKKAFAVLATLGVFFFTNIFSFMFGGALGLSFAVDAMSSRNCIENSTVWKSRIYECICERGDFCPMLKANFVRADFSASHTPLTVRDIGSGVEVKTVDAQAFDSLMLELSLIKEEDREELLERGQEMLQFRVETEGSPILYRVNERLNCKVCGEPSIECLCPTLRPEGASDWTQTSKNENRTQSKKEPTVVRRGQGKGKSSGGRYKAQAYHAEGYLDEQTMQVASLLRRNLYSVTAPGIAFSFVFVTGPYALINSHIHRTLLSRPDVVFTATNKFTSFDFTIKDIVSSTEAGNDSDFTVLDFGRHVCLHTNIIKHFVNDSEIVLTENSRAFIMRLCADGTYTHGHGTVALRRERVVVQNDSVPQSDPLFRYDLDSISYSIATSPGDCGSPVLLENVRIPSKILGIHCSGDKLGGACNIITRESLTKLLQSYPKAQLRLDPEIVESESVNVDNCVRLGSHPFKLTQSIKNEVQPSLLHNTFSPSSMKPTRLTSGFNIRTQQIEDPMQKAIHKYFCKTVPPPKELVERAAEDLFKKLKGLQTASDATLFGKMSLKQALMGDSFLEIPALNKTTSAGWPYVKKESTKKKTKLFGSFDWELDTPIAKEVMKECELVLTELTQGVQGPYFFIDTLKDEKRDAERVDDFKTRAFAAAPTALSVVGRQLFSGFATFMRRHRIYSEACVGINVHSKEWTDLYYHLARMSPYAVAGDFSNYDGTLCALILWAVCDLINKFYNDGRNYARETYFRHLVNSIHYCRGEVYQLNHSQPSGNPITVEINCLYNSIAARICWQMLAPSGLKHPFNFNRFVRFVAYGDDNLMTIHPDAIEYFNQHTLTTAFATFGMVYTDEAKGTNPPKYKSLDECWFLKREFVRWGCTVVAPLKLEQILEIPQWIRGSHRDGGTGLVVDNITFALQELFFHGEEVYDHWAGEIEEAFKESFPHYVDPLFFPYDALSELFMLDGDVNLAALSRTT